MYSSFLEILIQRMNKPHLYSVFNNMLQRHDKEQLLKQHGLVIWFTGLSGAGKSTLAMALERELHNRGLLCCLLDGDNIRLGINSNVGFSADDRTENIRRVAEVGKLFVNNGLIVIASFISPTTNLRSMASDIIGSNDYFEVYVSTPLDVCEGRDVKGLYAKARKGEIEEFTGISAPYEVPENPSLSVDTTSISVDDAVQKLLVDILPRVKGDL